MKNKSAKQRDDENRARQHSDQVVSETLNKFAQYALKQITHETSKQGKKTCNA